MQRSDCRLWPDNSKKKQFLELTADRNRNNLKDFRPCKSHADKAEAAIWRGG